MYTILSETDDFRLTTFPKKNRCGRDDATQHKIVDGIDIAEFFGNIANPADPGRKDDLSIVTRGSCPDGRSKRERESRGPGSHTKPPYLVILDVDDTLHSPSAASEFLEDEGIPHLIFTTYSHTEEAPRYRVITPFLVDSRETYEAVAKALFDIIEAEVAPESWATQGFFYRPCIKEGFDFISRMYLPCSWIPDIETEVASKPVETRNDLEALDTHKVRDALL